MSGQGESCKEACRKVNLHCTEAAWPDSEHELQEIAKEVGYECEEVQSGNSEYDPSAADMHCGWQGYVPRSRAGFSRCAAEPPSFSLRFCPCSETAEPKDLFNCDTDFATWRVDWSASKKDWCCKSKGKGCSGKQKESGKQFNCAAGLSNWEKAWSDAKKEWCCNEEGKGCKGSTTSAPYDCIAGHSNWKRGWSDGKKTWCCENQHRGCPYQVFGTGNAIDARRMCGKSHMRLPMPETELEEKALKVSVRAAVSMSMLSNEDGAKAAGIWLGGSYSALAGKWEWDDGSEVTAETTKAHQLNDGEHSPNEAAPWLAMRTDGRWVASLPDRKLSVLCRVDGK